MPRHPFTYVGNGGYFLLQPGRDFVGCLYIWDRVERTGEGSQGVVFLVWRSRAMWAWAEEMLRSSRIDLIYLTMCAFTSRSV